MSIDQCVTSFADEWDGEEDMDLPERKYIFDDQSFNINDSTDEVAGYNPLYSNSSLRGTDDVKTPDAGGAPVIGNFIRPERFDWKLHVKTGSYSNSGSSSVVKNWISFRLIWMLIFEFPRDDDDPAAMYNDLYETGAGIKQTYFLKPQYKQKVRVFHDEIVTIGDSPRFVVNARRNPSQAGYIVPPTAAGANPGWVVPAMSSAAESVPAQSFGGHHTYMEGSVDLEKLVRGGASLWRDPQQELEDQIMPTIQCFVVLEAASRFEGATALGTNANVNFSFTTRYSFAEG